MTDEMDGKNLAERVSLIESMMAEGRQGTARWGWTFVLWGVAYLVATAWSSGWVGGPVWSAALSCVASNHDRGRHRNRSGDFPDEEGPAADHAG